LWHWQFIVGVAVLAGMWLLARYAVQNWRREGAMTPIEAQAMEMNTPAPFGTAPVELATVTSGPVESTIRYTGQAVGYVEQDVFPRVRGWITWMPFYVGDRVKKGQVLARLDTSEIEPQIAERQAMENMARQGASVAQTEYRQMLEDVNRMRAEVRGKTAGITEARSEVNAARAMRSEAEAELTAAESMIADAEAMLEAARASNEYWTAQIARTRALEKAGAASGEEVQRDQAMAADAAAKERQALARLAQARAEVRAKQSAIVQADAAIGSANAKLAQMTSELEASRAQVRVAQAAADAARGRIGEAAAGVAQARASTATLATQRGYSEIRSLIDGVVTQRIISPGVLANPGQAILKVAQVAPIRLQVNVAEGDLANIRVGAPVVVHGQGGRGEGLTARVTSVSPSVDPTARIMRITAGMSSGPVRRTRPPMVSAEIQRRRYPGPRLLCECGAQ
jgi:multidrug resistance efflux pump